jgi:hypothetical protein
LLGESKNQDQGQEFRCDIEILLLLLFHFNHTSYSCLPSTSISLRGHNTQNHIISPCGAISTLSHHINIHHSTPSQPPSSPPYLLGTHITPVHIPQHRAQKCATTPANNAPPAHKSSTSLTPAKQHCTHLQAAQKASLHRLSSP